jgi:hypothetical protein
VHAKHPPVHNRPQRQIVKHVAAIPPNVAAAIFSLTLVVEPIHLRDLPRLVVSADERYAIGIPDFEEQEQEERLDRVETAVDKVACG